ARAGGDSTAAGAPFADDALLIFADGAPVRGRDAIARWTRGSAALETLRMTPESVRVGGGMAYLSGRFTVGASPSVTGGTFVAVLVEEQGRWRIQSQVFVPDRR
ncbi:MAG TPA: nuclear transport factor 2 family protein, partial [Longimicrobiaceae bacterium]